MGKVTKQVISDISKIYKLLPSDAWHEFKNIIVLSMIIANTLFDFGYAIGKFLFSIIAMLLLPVFIPLIILERKLHED